MSVSANDIIKPALSKIGVRNSEVALTATQTTDAIAELNDMMTQWDSTSLPLGYTIVSKGTDIITTPDWSHGAMKSNLSARLAPEYGKEISPTLGAQILSDFNALLLRIVEAPEVFFPDTLPLGSGNQRNESRNQNNFYNDDNHDDLLTANGDNLLSGEGERLEQDLTEENG